MSSDSQAYSSSSSNRSRIQLCSSIAIAMLVAGLCSYVAFLPNRWQVCALGIGMSKQSFKPIF